MFRRGTHADGSHDAEVDVLGPDLAADQQPPDRSGHDGEDHIVEGPSEQLTDRLDVRQVHGDPVEAAMRPDLPVDRCRGRRPQRAAERRCETARGRQQLTAHIPCLADRVTGTAQCAHRSRCPAESFANHQLHARGSRARHERRGLDNALILARRHQHAHDIDAGDAVDHAVMNLRDHRESIVLESLDKPHLPQRSPTIEVVLHDPRGQPLELSCIAGAGQAGVANMEVDAEAVVIDPHRVSIQRRPREPLPVARDHRQAAGDQLLERLGVDAAVGMAQRARIERHRRRDVHVGVVVLQSEKGIVESRQAVECVASHGSSPAVGAVQTGRRRRAICGRGICSPIVQRFLCGDQPERPEEADCVWGPAPIRSARRERRRPLGTGIRLP